MPRPINKQDLLAANRQEFERLLQLIDTIPAERRAEPGPCGDWSVKDILAHLHGWHEMFLGWYAAGQAGEKPAVPADGYKWSQLPALNDRIYQQYRDLPYETILQNLKSSYQAMDRITEATPEETLFAVNKSAWTGNNPLASYITGNGSSHYHWAYELIRKWKKANG